MAFVLWRPHQLNPVPKLVIGRFQPGNPPTLAGSQVLPLTRQAPHQDLWSIDAAQCGLSDGRTYH